MTVGLLYTYEYSGRQPHVSHLYKYNNWYETKSPTIARVSRPYRLYTKVSLRLPVAEKNDFSDVTAVPYTLH